MTNNNNKINEDNMIPVTDDCIKHCSWPFTWENILKALTEAIEAETGEDKTNVEKIIVNVPYPGWVIGRSESLPVWLSHETLDSCLRYLGSKWDIKFEINFDEEVHGYKLDIFNKEDK